MKKLHWMLSFALGLSITIPLMGCQSGGGGNQVSDSLGWGTRALICTGGGLAGSYIAKKLANNYFKKTSKTYTAKEIEQQTQAFQLGLFVTFCAIADYAGNTIYKRLSKDGEKERRAQVLAAATTARTTVYRDPSNPNLSGTITPSKTYQEVSSNRECIDMEDTLADQNNAETIYLKYCRSLPNGNYEPATV